MNQRNKAILGLLALSLSLPASGLRATEAPLPETSAPTYLSPSAGAGDPAPFALAGGAVRPETYTVVHGDTLTQLSDRFHCSVRQLKKLNGLKKTHLKAGLVLQIPPAPKKHVSLASAAKAPLSRHKEPFIAFHKPHAEPVQDFDLPASTFASCPVPIASDDEVPVAAPLVPSAPIQPLAQPLPLAPLASTPPPAPAVARPVPAPFRSNSSIAISSSRRSGLQPLPSGSATLGTPEFTFSSPTPAPAPPPKPAGHGLFGFLFNSPSAPDDWGTRFTTVARELGDRGLVYDENWCPPGESRSWAMDCSNTTRYLYRTAAHIELPRTASDQYYYLHLQNKAWDVPQTASGYADCNYLRQNLKPGDLLFWENTYRPERQPPITHVMIFLGTNARGSWIMAGSQSSRGGEHNRRRGGPDVYVFDPTKPCGGYTTWMGLVHHQGRFCAFGRPLEADKSKLSVAAND